MRSKYASGRSRLLLWFLTGDHLVGLHLSARRGWPGSSSMSISTSGASASMPGAGPSEAMGRHPGRGLCCGPPLKAGCGERSLLGPVGGRRNAPGSLGGVRLNPLGPVGGALGCRGGVSRCIRCWRGGDWSRRTGDSPPHRRGGGGDSRRRLPVGEGDREGNRLGLAGLPHCRILTGPSDTCANGCWALPHSRSRRGPVGGCCHRC